MTAQEKLDLITRNTEEILTKTDLKTLLKNNEILKHYIGLEISGRVHLGTGLMCMGKVRDFVKAGADCTVYLADWHTWINDKLGGDREVIRRMAVGYFKEALTASLKCLGGDPNKISFLLGTDLYHQADEYWATVIDVSKHITLARNLRSLPIMGRREGEGIEFAKLIYPPMQVADIFYQQLTIAHAGLDQRTAHVIMRDIALKMKVSPVRNKAGDIIKPVAIHHHLLLGLNKPAVWPIPKDRMQELWSAAKMSKSVPGSAVFIHDTPDEIRKKIGKAFCPPGEATFNPILDWIKHLIFGVAECAELTIPREKRFGSNLTFKHYKDVEEAYLKGQLHPQDLKAGVAEKIIEILDPARTHFADPERKEMLEEMEKLV